MNLTDGEVLRLLHGDPLFLEDICLVYSPKLGEIATAHLEKFHQYLSLMLVQTPTAQDDKELGKLVAQLSDFQYLLFLARLESEQAQLIKEAFEFFTHEKPTFMILPTPAIVVGDPAEQRMITEETFPKFQYLVRACCAMASNEPDIELCDDDSEQVRQLKLKLLKGRKDRAKAKAKQEAKKKENNVEFSDLVASLLVGSEGAVNDDTIWNLTYYAFQDRLKRMGWREEFNINTRAAMAGAKIDKEKLSHWIRTMSFN